MEKNLYLVCIKKSYVDGVAALTRPDGEFGGEGWSEMGNLPVVLDSASAETEEEAICMIAEKNGLDPRVLYVYQLQTENKFAGIKIPTNMDEIIEAIADRISDYSENATVYEEEYEGQIEEDPDANKCYHYGYEKALEAGLELLGELQSINEAGHEPVKQQTKIV